MKFSLIISSFFLISFYVHAETKKLSFEDSIRYELSLQPHDTTQINLWIELGRIYSKEHKDSIFKIANNLLKLSEKSNSARGKTFAYEFFFHFASLQGNYDDALGYLQKALILSKKHLSITHQANLIFLIANTHNIKGNHQKAVNYYLECLKLFEELGDEESYSSIYNNLGLLFQARKEYEKAKTYYYKSWHIDSIYVNKKQLATTLNNIGGLYQEQEYYDTALVFFQKSMDLYEELDYKIGLAHGYNNIGIIYYYQGYPDTCMQYFLKSLEMRIAIGIKADISQSYNNIGILYKYEDDYKNAAKYSQKALEVALESGLKIEIIDAYISLYDIYYADKQYQKSADMLMQYVNYKDTVFTENQQKSIAEMETKYDTEKKEKENQLLLSKNKLQEAQLETQKLLQYFYIAIAIAIFFIFILTGYSLMQKRKDNALLREQKMEIADKNEELNQQNEEIIAISDKIEEQNNTLNKKNQDILASIAYAKRIQLSILPSDIKAKEHLPESFVLYKPKDIVSGDFYWMEVVGNKVFWAAVDCTGHGVPGAFMSIVGANGLKKIVVDNSILKPSEILTLLTEYVIESVADSKDGRDIMDGMDIALCCWDKTTNKVEYAGAYNPLYLIRSNSEVSEIEIIKATKRPIGRYLSNKVKEFENHEFQVQNGDLLYVFTDGYADQFGGEKGMKFSYNRFQNILLENTHLPMEQQKEILITIFENWKSDEKQLDDVCIIGVRI